MTGFLKSIVLLCSVLSVLTGCQALTGRTLGENIDDTNITATVQTQLTAEKASNFLRVDVDTNNRVVYLNGTVPSAEQKARAEQIARRVGGVKDVVNNLQVSP
jgi:osmotically-inducible protein OsmY